MAPDHSEQPPADARPETGAAPRTVTLDQALAIALDHHRAGRLDAASAIYAEILTQHPTHVDAVHLLGVALGRLGRTREAVRLLARAIELKPDFAPPYGNLATVLRELGRHDEAETLLRKTVALAPRDTDAHVALGGLLATRGKLAEAVPCFERAAALQPGAQKIHLALADMLLALGRLEDALPVLRRAIEIDADTAPAYERLGRALTGLARHHDAEVAFRAAIAREPAMAEAQCNLGVALVRQGRFDDALAAADAAIALSPSLREAHQLRASALRELGRPAEALEAYRAGFALGPRDAVAHNDLGVACHGLGFAEAALRCLSDAIRLDPARPAPYVNLGIVLEGMARSDDAADVYRRAIALDPTLAEAHNNLANLLREQGRIGEALAGYRRALEIRPDPRIHSNLIHTMGQDPATPMADAQAELRRWYRIHHARGAARHHAWANPPDPDRRLRIGYVSADFRRHSASYCFAPLLAGHDRERFEPVCYSATLREDDRTALFKSSASTWRTILGLSDAALAAMIRADGIDVLVDLSGHTAGNRLPLFTAKPAPIQVTVFGPSGTGIPEIDLLLADPVLLSADERRGFVERVVDLPCVLTYEPPADAPEVGPLPAVAHGAITFGCLNRFSKVTDRALQVWSRILGGEPTSRLLLKDRVFSDPEVCRRTLARLAGHGVPAERVVLQGGTTIREHLAAHGAVDLALDPFPMNGGISSLEALWMGVPVVSRHDDQPAPGRVGASIMAALGLPDFIARDDDDYVALALRHAADRDGLAALRAGLRARMRGSAVGDPARFVAAVETIYRDAWQRWCAGRPPAA